MSSMVADGWWKKLTADSDESESSHVPVSVIREQLPEISNRWDEFVQLLTRKLPTSGPGELLETELNFRIFRDVVLQMMQSDQINVSMIFQTVARNLELAVGEMRLMAITNQPIGNNLLSPRSTQSQQQSLVVVHLKRPPLPAARGDTNAIEDFFSRSDQDWLAEQAEYEDWDKESGDQEQGTDENDD